jgi:predicted RNase H-like nuclease (RuvC/YqgF family)
LSEKELEERRAYIRGLSEKERFILSHYGQDFLEKYQKLQQIRKEESETLKQKAIEETKTFTIEEIMTEILSKIDAPKRAKKKIGKLIEETYRLREKLSDDSKTIEALRKELDNEEREFNFEVTKIFEAIKTNNPKLYEALKKYINIMKSEGILKEESENGKNCSIF